MSNSNRYTLTGGDYDSGGAIDNTQTDVVEVGGADNFFYSLGGNLTVVPENPVIDGDDTATSIFLDKYGDPAQPSYGVSAVTDSITLDGSDNLLSNLNPVSGNPTPIFASNISFTVNNDYPQNDFGGSNTVSLTHVSSSTISVVDNGPAGGDTVITDNRDGLSQSGGPAYNNITLSGPDNDVSLVSDATNTVIFTSTSGGMDTVTVGYHDDHEFGDSTSISLAGIGNTVVGGDANFTISGSTGTSTVSLGNGTDSVSLGGADNSVTVDGGNDTINAGGGGSSVYILGYDGGNFDEPVDAPIPVSPTDYVTISGVGDTVDAGYENVIVTGLAITAASVSLGDGNNSVTLAGPGGFSTVTVGNGGNGINVAGNFNNITVGDGFNGITTSGNYNTITAEDSSGVGYDNVQLSQGSGDYVQLNYAGGSVTGAGLGTTTIYQTGGSPVVVNLGNGIGQVTLGDGNDTVNVQGADSLITVGNGTDAINANGNSDHITAGNGNDHVTANGSSDLITLGDGNDHLTATGQYDQISVGNGNDTLVLSTDHNHYQGSFDVVTAGNGMDNITDNGNSVTGVFGNTTGRGKGEAGLALMATGSGDSFTVIASAGSTNTFSIGSNSTLAWESSNAVGTPGGNSGEVIGTLFGANDTITLDNTMRQGTQIYADGNNESITLDQEAGGYLTLNPSSTGDTITLDADSTYSYKRQLDLSGFGSGDTVDLEGVKDTSGHLINNFATLFTDLAKGASPTGDTLSFQGGGSLTFDKVTNFNASEFSFSTNVNGAGVTAV